MVGSVNNQGDAVDKLGTRVCSDSKHVVMDNSP